MSRTITLDNSITAVNYKGTGVTEVDFNSVAVWPKDYYSSLDTCYNQVIVYLNEDVNEWAYVRGVLHGELDGSSMGTTVKEVLRPYAEIGIEWSEGHENLTVKCDLNKTGWYLKGDSEVTKPATELLANSQNVFSFPCAYGLYGVLESTKDLVINMDGGTYTFGVPETYYMVEKKSWAFHYEYVASMWWNLSEGYFYVEITGEGNVYTERIQRETLVNSGAVVTYPK